MKPKSYLTSNRTISEKLKYILCYSISMPENRLRHILLIFCSVIVLITLAGCSKKRIKPALNIEFLENHITDIKAKVEMPSGTAIAVVKGNRVIYEGYFGHSDIEKGILVDKNTLFYIASTTKAYLALATLIAEHNGDLNESSTLRELFPKTPFNSITPDDITVKHLLTHTSGIDQEAFTWAGSWTGQHDASLRRKFVSSLYPDKNSKLGEFNYTNLGYNVMSVWFEEYYKKDWRTTLKKSVLDPLQMTKTSGFMSDIEKNNWQFARPYSYKYKDGKEQVYLVKDDKTMYSIGLISTVKDVSNLIIAELNDGVIDGKQIIPADVIQKSQIKHVDLNSYFDGYSWGWMHGEFKGEKEIFHTGGFEGASALISFLPDHDIGIVILQNESGLKANYLGGIIKNMIYSMLLEENEKVIISELDNDVEDLLTSILEAKLKLAQQDADKRNTPLNLSLAKESYVGTYTNNLAGEIIITHDELENLNVKWGNIQGKAYGNQEKDKLDINFRPGKYYDMQFILKDSILKSLEINGQTFIKSKN